MFERQELAKVLDLSLASYRLLMWVNSEVKKGHNLFSKKHQEGSTFDTARAWLTYNYDQFPPHLKFDQKDLDRVAHLFMSYLQTSLQFTVVQVPEWVCSYHCCFCGSVINQTQLAQRPTSKGDKEAAFQLKKLYVKGLAEEIGLPLVDDEVAKFVGRTLDIGKRVTLCTYVAELYRRSEFASQGGGVYVLWRELKSFQDDEKNKKKKEVLNLDEILQEEAQLKLDLQEFAQQL